MNTDKSLLSKLHSETAKIHWHELETFFARGVVLHVADELDLIEIAAQFANDDSSSLAAFIKSNKIAPPTNDNARKWHDANTLMWSVVVAPFVLVQQIIE